MYGNNYGDNIDKRQRATAIYEINGKMNVRHKMKSIPQIRNRIGMKIIPKNT